MKMLYKHIEIGLLMMNLVSNLLKIFKTISEGLYLISAY